MVMKHQHVDDERTNLLSSHTTLTSLFDQPQDDVGGSIKRDSEIEVPILGSESPKQNELKQAKTAANELASRFACTQSEMQSTFVGSTVFLLYQVVFCLAQAATITRPHASHSSTGAMAQMAALGIMTGGPLFLWELADQVPAIYPASDLFLAPFLAGLSTSIDQVMWEHGVEDDDRIFLATFGMVLAAGFILSGALCILAARVKLANLGAFLPYSVLCGFFTTIGILMWTLGFSVDVGQKVGQVATSGDWVLIRHAALHHAPSLCVGVTMHLLGPKNPLFVILLVLCTVAGSYVVMWATGTTLAAAQAQQWFFSAEDLLPQNPTLSFKGYAPPAPFGVWVSAWRGEVMWEAFFAGIPMMLALIFLYLVRCSLHSAALKKNIPNVTRKVDSDEDSNSSVRSSRRSSHRGGAVQEPLTLNFLLEHGYGYTQVLTGLVGGIPIAPAVAASLTLFKLRAETPPPQYGSCFLIIIFYFTNFTLVQYIPKPAFSALMVLAGLDMVRTWIFDSYYKTKAKWEWMVGPILVILSFTIGLLNAIFVGVAVSTFIFAANFYNAGAVKFVGSGLSLRSTVERGIREGDWLDTHGDWIQILVVQNYLFFGNCQSLLTYITTMFEDEDDAVTNPDNMVYSIPPKPKYLVVDFSMVNGMDTSAVDMMKETIALCETNRCKLYLSGLNPSLKSNLLYAGLKPHLRFWTYTNDMETALAKAEDALLSTEFHLEERDEAESSIRRRQRSSSVQDDGFVYALKKIDEQHGLKSAEELADLASWTQPIDLQPGDVLFRESDHGLYFVETGLLRVQWSVGNTTHNFANLTLNGMGTPNASASGQTILANRENDLSIGHLNARSPTVGRETALWKEQHSQHTEQTFRLARIGQGWIIGGIEAANGMKQQGVHVAISSCRLHHLPRSAIQENEENNPKLAMNMYRMLSHLATKRQEMTIEHLGQHLRILNSPVPRLRGKGKAGLALLQAPGRLTPHAEAYC